MSEDDPLIRSAQDFLIEALRDLSDDKLKFAVLNAITAAELALKARLWRLNPGLIFRNIDARSGTDERTVGLSAIPNRLANLGLPLSDDDRELIRETLEWRHQVVHSVVNFDTDRARHQIGRLLDFLASFMSDDLKTPLQSFLPRDMYKDVSGLLAGWKAVLAQARRVAEGEGGVIADPCPRCGGSGVLTLGPNEKVHCHLCQAELFRIESCDGCGRPTFVQYASFPGDNYCDDCVETAGDQWVQQQIDLLRGK